MSKQFARGFGHNLRQPIAEASFRQQVAPLHVPSTEMQDVLRHDIYDTQIFTVGNLIETRPIEFFQVPVSQETHVANSSSSKYVKRRSHTNIEGNYQIPKDYQFQVETIEAQVAVFGNVAAAEGTGNDVGFAFQPGGPGNTTNFGPVTSASKLLQAILDSFYLETFYGSDKRYEHGLLIGFPTQFGISGSSGGILPLPDANNNGGAGAAVTNALNETFVQNGFGRPRFLAVPRILEPLDRFKFSVTPQHGFVASNTFFIRLWMTGYLFRHVQ